MDVIFFQSLAIVSLFMNKEIKFGTVTCAIKWNEDDQIGCWDANHNFFEP